jgi:hypothetical protein
MNQCVRAIKEMSIENEPKNIPCGGIEPSAKELGFNIIHVFNYTPSPLGRPPHPFPPPFQ